MFARKQMNARFGVPIRTVMLAVLIVTLALSVGCDKNPTEQEDYVPEPVLTAFIHTGEPVDTIYVEWVGLFHAPYDPAHLGVDNANVVMYPVQNADGSDADSTGRALYFHQAGIGGEYAPNNLAFIPETLVRYRMEVHSSEVDLHAETTVPDTFSWKITQDGNPVSVDPLTNEFQGARGDTLTRMDAPLYFEWTESVGADGYELGILTDVPRAEAVPIDTTFDMEDQDTIDMLKNVALYGYQPAPDYQRAITLIGAFFFWQGRTRVSVVAGSYDYYNYMFTNLVFSSMGATVNPYSNVIGGRGIFGATVRRDIYVTIARSF